MTPKLSFTQLRRAWLFTSAVALIAISALAGAIDSTPLHAQQVSLTEVILNFESLPPQRSYKVGESFMDAGVIVQVDAFYWGNGTRTDNGHADVQNHQYAGGSGNDIFTNNVNLRFLIPGVANTIMLAVAAMGGNLNIEINGEFRNFGSSFDEIVGTTIGGVSVVMESNPSGNGTRQGRLILTGDVTSFAIGGQELALDDVYMQGSFTLASSQEAAVRILLVTQGDRVAEYHVSILPDVARGHPNEFNQWVVTVLDRQRVPLDAYGVWDPRLILIHEVDGAVSRLVRDSDTAYLFDIVFPLTNDYNGGLPVEVLLYDQGLTLLADINLSAAINEYCAGLGRENITCATISLPINIDPISSLPGAPFNAHPLATTNEAILADSESVAACLPGDLIARPELQALLQTCGLLK